jgi:glucose/arabinose dehydrogenase
VGRRASRAAAAAGAVIAVCALPAAARAVSLPAGFVDEPVAAVESPTAVAFTPRGSMLIATQPGVLRVFRDGALRAAPPLDISAKVCSNSERGLLGVAVDPAFAANRFIYLYYTWKKTGTCPTGSATAPVNRVSRFVLGPGDTVNPASEVVLVDNISSFAGNHNAGDLAFGPDGYLYVSVGDGGCDYAGGGCGGANDAARDRNVLLGKILRITRDGGIPPGNPFVGAGTAVCGQTGSTSAGQVCRETFAWGLRNPFRIAFDSSSPAPRLHVNDVGQGTWEEIDLGVAGADYGWNVREGPCATGSTTSCGAPPAGMTNPIYAYGRSSGCASITGGAFVPAKTWPSPYSGSYLFADYACGTIFRLQPSVGGGYTRVPFATGLGANSAVHLEFSPRQRGSVSLVYTSYAGGVGSVRRIRYVNSPPTAALQAAPTTGPAPLTVTFDASGSSDPDGGSLTCVWTFGDGWTLRTSDAVARHTYATPGVYTATVRVRDTSGATSAPAGVLVTVGAASVPGIVAPPPGAAFVARTTDRPR